MDLKKILKIISAIVAIAGVAVAIYFAIQKLTAPKEPEYFDDNDFFECDNEIEIIEVKKEEKTEAPEKAKKEAQEKPAKKTAKKKAAKAE